MARQLPPRRPLQRGLTLIEVLIALAIIGIAFGVLALTQVTTMKVGADSRRASDATEYANAQLEEQSRLIRRAFKDYLDNCPTQDSCTKAITASPYLGTLSWGTEGSGYLEEGLIRVSATLIEPSNVEFTRVVSCIDVNPPPSVAVPGPCPFKVVP